MKIQTLKNMKALIYGADPKRVKCDTAGKLKVGDIEVDIAPGAESVMPLIANGCSGYYKATFTDGDGNVYDIDNIVVKSGRISPPTKGAVEIMELRHRIDDLEAKNEKLERAIDELRHIFDTNSLNFLIYEGDKK